MTNLRLLCVLSVLAAVCWEANSQYMKTTTCRSPGAGNVHRLTCEQGKVLIIRGIFYGRRRGDSRTCSNTWRSSNSEAKTRCTTKALARLIRTTCMWNRGCAVPVSKLAALSTLGCRMVGSNYYVQTRYSCLKLRNPTSRGIRRRRARYIVSRMNCPKNTRVIIHFKKGQSYKYKSCQRKQQCRVFLRGHHVRPARYVCMPPTKHVAVACEGKSLKLSCSASNMTVKVLYVFYGISRRHRQCTRSRSRRRTCGTNKRRARYAARRQCAGKRMCVLKAANGVFKNTCPRVKGNPRVLYVKFKCV